MLPDGVPRLSQLTYFQPKMQRSPDPLDVVPLITGFDDSGIQYVERIRVHENAFGQNAEDVYAYQHFFWGMTAGVFLELGAYDGYTFSNTFLYERFLNWTGVLIEPGAENYRRLVANRPAAARLRAAICSQKGKVHLVDNINIGGVWEFMTPAFRQKWHPGVDVASLPTIDCMPLSEVLAELRVSHINFMSLDVEGGELEVLQTLDFAQVTVDVLVLEAWPDDDARNQHTITLLESHDLALHAKEEHNWWFVRRGFEASAAPPQPA